MCATRWPPRNSSLPAWRCRWSEPALLPQLAFSASVSKVKGTRDFGNALNQDVRVPLNYEAPQYGLSLRAPVFNFERSYGCVKPLRRLKAPRP
jgi:hypothetical protein